MARAAVVSSNHVIEERLTERASDLEKAAGGHVLAIKSLLMTGIDDFIRFAVEKRTGAKKGKKLLVVLETDGGLIEVARRIADTLHHHYRIVEYLVPNHAMSAGTVLVMSGDAIHMDHYSVLGPIDPQVRSQSRNGGQWVPGLGYIAKFNELMDKAANGGLNTAEMAYLLEKFDPAFLYQLEQERNLSVTLLRQWLVKYKFKDWSRTQRRKIPVTKQLKKDRAEQIANKLNDTKLWHSHGRGIPMEMIRRMLNLKVENFAEHADLNRCVRVYDSLLSDYMSRRGHTEAIQTCGLYRGFEVR